MDGNDASPAGAASRAAPAGPALEAWLSRHVPGFRGPVSATALDGGQSNPTFKLTSPSGRIVLRRKPLGRVLQSAHAVDREFRVLQALDGTGVPVPKVHALCRDDTVIGTSFYVMDYVEGRIFFDPRLPELTSAERGAIFRSMADAVAALHGVDPTAAGLADFGRPTGFMQRQFARWSQQYRLSETVPIPAMDRLIAWLPDRLPRSDDSRIVHGDLRLDNMMIHPTEPRVVAVLDWELSTLGDPLCDLGYNVLAWRLEPEVFRGLVGVDLAALGIPDERQYLDRYLGQAGRTDLPDWEVYVIFSLFRLAAILQGIAKRALEGSASGAAAQALGAKAAPVAERGWALAQGVGA